MNPHHRRAIALTALGCALALAACGSSAKSTASTAGTSQYAHGVRYSDCMRAHGVPNFPDPGPNGFDISGIDTQTPAFQSAHQACTPLQPAGSADHSPASESKRLAAINNAKCMRSHGVPSFPDPKFLPSGGNGVSLNGLDTQSPAFKHAQAACPW
jgi:hypothetical protein